MKIYGATILLILSAHAYAQDSVTIREASKNHFVATLLSESELGIEESQQRVLTAAIAACKSLAPEFGHYEFKSIKRVSAPSPAPDSFEFNQEFTCLERASEAPVQATETVISEAEQQKLVELVTSETRKIIGISDNDALRAFHSKFSPTLSEMLSITEWIEQQTLLHKNSGFIKPEPFFKVTTYIDPPNSPGPGVYLAVDFQASYEKAPYRCGYVMWLFDQKSDLSVLRVEDGIIYTQDAASMSPEELEQTKQQFRCFAP